MKTRVYEILEKGKRDDSLGQFIDIFLVSLIILNILAVILESVNSIYTAYKTTFLIFEIISVSLFTTEYVLRIWVSNLNERYRHPITGRLRYMVSFMALIDLLAILPFYLAFLTVDLRILRALRIFRFVRLAKLTRYVKALQFFGSVIRKKRAELGVTAMIMAILLILASSLMYFAEHEAQPDKFSSIPAAMWWAVATLTTVGYGDILPVTALGKTMGSIIAILGIGMFALPAGLLGSAFIEEINERKKKPLICPHCGKQVN